MTTCWVKIGQPVEDSPEIRRLRKWVENQPRSSNPYIQSFLEDQGFEVHHPVLVQRSGAKSIWKVRDPDGFPALMILSDEAFFLMPTRVEDLGPGPALTPLKTKGQITGWKLKSQDL